MDAYMHSCVAQKWQAQNRINVFSKGDEESLKTSLIRELLKGKISQPGWTRLFTTLNNLTCISTWKTTFKCMDILPVNGKQASVNQFMEITELCWLIPAEDLIWSVDISTNNHRRNALLSYFLLFIFFVYILQVKFMHTL